MANRKYCGMCDEWFLRGRDCSRCGYPLETAARRKSDECPLCEGDGFGPLGGNCEQCGGGGKVKPELRGEHREAGEEPAR